MSNATGTKLSCVACGSQVAVTKGGGGEVQCCGQPMLVVSGQRPAASTPASTSTRPPAGKTDDPYYD